MRWKLVCRARHVKGVRKADTTFARECDFGVARRLSHMRRGRCRIASIIRLLGVTSEFCQFAQAKDKLTTRRLPEDMSLDLGALLEPLGVAIQASKRAQLAPGATVLVFGAGAVGLLVAAMAKISGAGTVVIADIDEGRVNFAVENKFAHRKFIVPMKRGATTEEQLDIAKETAAAIGKITKESGAEVDEVDAVFECTGVPSCVQASIYVCVLGEPTSGRR